MGSKNLKAIATGGTKGISIAAPKRFIKLVNQMCQSIVGNKMFAAWREWGTLSAMDGMIAGTFLSTTYQNAKERAGDREVLGEFALPHLVEILDRHGNISCLACPIGCKHSFRLKKGGVARGVSLGRVLCWRSICLLRRRYCGRELV
jgi:aldehyde:ferredoxin oxidoreductase